MEKLLRQPDNALFSEAYGIIENARANAYSHINYELVLRNWRLGKLIAEEELNHNDRAKYGQKIIANLSKYLTETFGKGFSRRDLYNYLNFYRIKQNLFSCESNGSMIVYSLSTQSSKLLSWTHYRTLLQELNTDARE